MNFLDVEIKSGDDITLQRDKSRVTVTYKHPMVEIFHSRVVGFVDNFGTNWYTDTAHRTGAWEIVGHSQNVPEEPLVDIFDVPDGYYLGHYLTSEATEVFIRKNDLWSYVSNQDHPFTEEELRTYLLSLTPMYVAGEHYTIISSDGVTIYDLVPDGDSGELTCNCKGYIYRETCKHVYAYSEALDSNGR